MLDLSTVNHHQAIEDMVDVISNKTQNPHRDFFRVVAAYFLTQVAGSMRARVIMHDENEMPVNIYAIALGNSGFGKNYSVNICEEEFFAGFRKRFLEEAFPVVSDTNLWRLAVERSAVTGTSEDEEHTALEKEFKQAGNIAFAFDSATPAAVKQLRHKLLLSGLGAINLQIDEIGLNLLGSVDVLTVFLELFDKGLTKNKLTKNTVENTRAQEVHGQTPANMLLFGTPSKLFDGGQSEDMFTAMLDTGYARRCLFAWGLKEDKEETRTAEEIYQSLVNPNNKQLTQQWSTHFTSLADPTLYGWAIEVPDAVGIEIVRYKLECERRARTLPENDGIRRSEMENRHAKTIKLAGTFAFIEQSSEMTIDHLAAAMKLVEESGEAFSKMMSRERNYMKLARHIASSKGAEHTHADLMQSLNFYKSGNASRNELMGLAMAWGYRNHIIIRKTFREGIEFFSGETLKETNLEEIILSHSDHFAYNYEPCRVPFTALEDLAKAPGHNWANHYFENQHRAEDNVQEGFNLVVLDCDGGVPLKVVHELLADYTFMTYTTKRHTDEENRFRIVIPINYELHLDQEDYRAFMDGIIAWLPFGVDEAANQRARKWATHEGTQVHFNQGILLDALPFIPKTFRNEQYLEGMKELGSLDNLERWFAQRMTAGNRNNHMIRFALALVDSGMGYSEVERCVLEFNSKLSNKLSETELRSTVLKSVAQRMSAARAAATTP